jgi:hypothetical protein
MTQQMISLTRFWEQDMTDATQKLIESAQAALEWITETGLGNSEEVASRFHLEMKGYRPAEHTQVDADVSAGCAVAESLRTALAAARQEAAHVPEVRAAEQAEQYTEPTPVAFDMVAAMKSAQEIVEGKALWKWHINGTPLANDIAVWMACFAREYAAPQPPKE